MTTKDEVHAAERRLIEAAFMWHAFHRQLGPDEEPLDDSPRATRARASKQAQTVAELHQAVEAVVAASEGFVASVEAGDVRDPSA